MLTPGLHILLYLSCGGVILTWLNPIEPMARFTMIPGVILLLAVVHSIISQKLGLGNSAVAVNTFQPANIKKKKKEEVAKDRRTLQMVYHTFYYEEVELLVQTMRKKGLHPMMVTQSKTGDFGEPVYQIMLPDAEVRRGQSLANRFRGKREHSS